MNSSSGAALADDAVSINSFETILPSYSEATLPSYSPPASSDQATRHSTQPSTSPSATRTRVTRPPPIAQPQILSISQSNLPLRFNGPSHPWSPKIVYPNIPPRKRKPGPELNIFFRNNKPPTAALAHGDTSEIPPFARRPSIPPRTTGRTYDEAVRMRELDDLTRAISQGSRDRDPKPVPQIAGRLKRESRLLGEEWDNLAVEAQREEIIIRISELESQFQQRLQQPFSTSATALGLAQEIADLQSILVARKEDVSNILSLHVSRLRELKAAGTRVSHVQKDQIKNDIFSMKGEIAFLEQQAADLEKFARIVKQDDLQRTTERSALEDDSNNWDMWFEANSGRR